MSSLFNRLEASIMEDRVDTNSAKFTRKMPKWRFLSFFLKSHSRWPIVAATMMSAIPDSLFHDLRKDLNRVPSIFPGDVQSLPERFKLLPAHIAHWGETHLFSPLTARCHVYGSSAWNLLSSKDADVCLIVASDTDLNDNARLHLEREIARVTGAQRTSVNSLRLFKVTVQGGTIDLVLGYASGVTVDQVFEHALSGDRIDPNVWRDARMDDASEKAITGVSNYAILTQCVAGREALFCVLLDLFRTWVMRREMYGSRIGFLGGIACACIVASYVASLSAAVPGTAADTHLRPVSGDRSGDVDEVGHRLTKMSLNLPLDIPLAEHLLHLFAGLRRKLDDNFAVRLPFPDDDPEILRLPSDAFYVYPPAPVRGSPLRANFTMSAHTQEHLRREVHRAEARFTDILNAVLTTPTVVWPELGSGQTGGKQLGRPEKTDRNPYSHFELLEVKKMLENWMQPYQPMVEHVGDEKYMLIMALCVPDTEAGRGLLEQADAHRYQFATHFAQLDAVLSAVTHDFPHLRRMRLNLSRDPGNKMLNAAAVADDRDGEPCLVAYYPICIELGPLIANFNGLRDALQLEVESWGPCRIYCKVRPFVGKTAAKWFSQMRRLFAK